MPYAGFFKLRPERDTLPYQFSNSSEFGSLSNSPFLGQSYPESSRWQGQSRILPADCRSFTTIREVQEKERMQYHLEIGDHSQCLEILGQRHYSILTTKNFLSTWPGAKEFLGMYLCFCNNTFFFIGKGYVLIIVKKEDRCRWASYKRLLQPMYKLSSK